MSFDRKDSGWPIRFKVIFRTRIPEKITTQGSQQSDGFRRTATDSMIWRERVAVDERLVSPGLLSAIGGWRRCGAKSKGPGFTLRPRRTEGAKENATGRFVSLHRSVLLTLHGGHSGKR